jgi:AraC family transcriptional activator of pyochelin receptor
MAGEAEHRTQQAFDPSTIREAMLEGVHRDWRHAMYLHQPGDGLNISCINGRPGGIWEFEAEGPPAFSINILLEGRMQAAVDDGSVIDVKAGSVALLASGQYTHGWDALDGKCEGAFRMVSIHMPQNIMAALTGLHMDDLRQRMRSMSGEQSHVDAFFGSTLASSSLQRVASELLGFGCSDTAPSISRDLYLRAKGFEAIACFLHEHLARQEIVLPVPSDRNRLMEAHALLEKTYGQDWSVQLLAHTVGLNEKRLQAGFSALFGSSVHAHLTRIRLNAAMTLLRGGASVTDTAAACGFVSLSHFSRVFRHHTGISPKQCSLGMSPTIQQPANVRGNAL